MQIFDSHTRKKTPFVPLAPGKVTIYCCGPTVYDYFHMGNARPFVVFDTLRRFMEYQGYEVIFVQNFTDVDDKMIRRANEENTTVEELGERFIAAYYEDAGKLGVRKATIHPRATHHIPEMIALIEKLMTKGLAYEKNGDVYFDTAAFPQYGSLSGQSLEELSLGARIDVGEEKKNAMDFALWKSQKPGEIAWDSPWSKGRPGWHIECSAMAMKYLGETIDIHCGGEDLLFPHHENEVAQSCGATAKPFVRYWMHNGFIQVNNQKMSKSLGNFFSIRDVLARFDPEVIRFYLLSAHYRSPLQFADSLLEQAKSALERLYNTLGQLKHLQAHAVAGPVTAERQEVLQKLSSAFATAMQDDLNTADALATLFDLAKDANTSLNEQSGLGDVTETLKTLLTLSGILGLLQKDEEGLPDDIQKLLTARAEARAQKNWAQSDSLRDQIKAQGYGVEDTSQGQKCRKL